MKKIPLLMLVLSVAGGPAALTMADEAGGWNYKITPYLWAMGVDGDVGVGKVSAPIDIKFTDAIEDLEVGGMLAFEADKDDLVLFLDGSYINLDDSKPTPLGALRAEMEQWIVEGAVGYKAVKGDELSLDLGAGYRVIGTDIDLNVPSERADLSESKSWGDPILVARLKIAFAKNCFGVISGDVGGFGIESDLTAQATAAAGYLFSESVAGFLGYRYLYYDYEDDDFFYDAETSGMILGVQFRL